MPPLTSQELEQISRDIASNGMSLQNIQDWITKLPENGIPDTGKIDPLSDTNDDGFDVDEFLSTADSPHEEKDDVGEPDRKRVRVS